MKPLLLATVIICIIAGSVLGQDDKQKGDLVQTIRRLELAESDALLRRDVAALEKLWAEDLTVNNPQNQISRGRKNVLDRVRAGLINYSSFVREIESVGLYGDMAIVMGLEIVTPSGNNPRAGQTLRRRYTNVWMKRMDNWSLAVRHANVVCQN